MQLIIGQIGQIIPDQIFEENYDKITYVDGIEIYHEEEKYETSFQITISKNDSGYNYRLNLGEYMDINGENVEDQELIERLNTFIGSENSTNIIIQYCDIVEQNYRSQNINMSHVERLNQNRRTNQPRTRE